MQGTVEVLRPSAPVHVAVQLSAVEASYMAVWARIVALWKLGAIAWSLDAGV